MGSLGGTDTGVMAWGEHGDWFQFEGGSERPGVFTGFRLSGRGEPGLLLLFVPCSQGEGVWATAPSPCPGAGMVVGRPHGHYSLSSHQRDCIRQVTS